MSNSFVYSVADAISGAGIEGAAIYDNISTSCCNCWPSGCSGCNGCTSGQGYQITLNTDASGTASEDAQFTCPQTHDILVTANGYNDTHVQPSSGPLDGPVNLPTILMVPTKYVPQTNQGGAGATQAGITGASATTGVSTTVLVAIGAVAFVFLIVAVVALKH